MSRPDYPNNVWTCERMASSSYCRAHDLWLTELSDTEQHVSLQKMPSECFDFILPCTDSSPHNSPAKQSQNISEPSACFTVGMLFLSFKASSSVNIELMWLWPKKKRKKHEFCFHLSKGHSRRSTVGCQHGFEQTPVRQPFHVSLVKVLGCFILLWCCWTLDTLILKSSCSSFLNIFHFLSSVVASCPFSWW